VFAASLVGRLSYSTVSLALLFSVRTATGSYASAGLAAAAFGATCAALAPLRARQVDRWGPRRALRFLAASYVVALALLAAACATQVTPPAALVVLSAAAGVFPPPLGPVMRGLWAELAPEPEMRQRAYSADSAAEQVLYTVGPLISGLIVAVASGTWALGVTAALLAAGAVGMSRSPLCRTWTLSGAGPVDRAARPLRQPGFRAVLLVILGIGTALGIVELAVVAFAQQHDLRAGVGVLLGFLSLGSVGGGLLYGHRSWRRPPGTRLLVITTLMALVIGLLAAATHPVTLAIGLLATGAFLSPASVTGYLLADELTLANSRTEATTWINTGSNAGAAAGTAVAGLLVDQLGVGQAFLIAAGVLAVATATSALSGRRSPIDGDDVVVTVEEIGSAPRAPAVQ
jgi:MFS family permease